MMGRLFAVSLVARGLPSVASVALRRAGIGRRADATRTRRADFLCPAGRVSGSGGIASAQPLQRPAVALAGHSTTLHHPSLLGQPHHHHRDGGEDLDCGAGSHVEKPGERSTTSLERFRTWGLRPGSPSGRPAGGGRRATRRPFLHVPNQRLGVELEELQRIAGHLDLELLLSGCEAQIARAPEEDLRRLVEVRRKIAQAQRLADGARRRKERLGLGR